MFVSQTILFFATGIMNQSDMTFYKQSFLIFGYRADQLVSAGGSGAPTQVVYTTTDDGQMIQSHYQTVGYTTTAVETAESQEQEITF